MAGYSCIPLAEKLGIKDGHKCIVIGESKNYFDLMNPLPNAKFVRTGKDLDFIHIFTTTIKDLTKQFLANKKLLKKDGMMWISWPKRSSNTSTDLDGNIIRDFGLRNGLVDVKVCAVDETWSGLKFVYRLSDR